MHGCLHAPWPDELLAHELCETVAIHNITLHTASTAGAAGPLVPRRMGSVTSFSAAMSHVYVQRHPSTGTTTSHESASVDSEASGSRSRSHGPFGVGVNGQAWAGHSLLYGRGSGLGMAGVQPAVMKLLMRGPRIKVSWLELPHNLPHTLRFFR